MNETRTQPKPRTATPAAAPARVHPTPVRPARPLPVLPTAPQAPGWTHRLLPAPLRRTMAGLGWWQNPTPQRPSTHLEQTLDVLHRYGWCQSLDVSPTGRMCIRGAQTLLERTGHVTPHARERAVAYMQHTLTQAGIQMSFFTWNDLPGQTLPAVENLLVSASRAARANGE
ncbi:DUF6197 family protein (plasmid) [Streptomyces sp. GDS52]|uniref:DUF6197 family protein n=1 Tax=Streptomyces sp. GDS52 TaxID=3406419 RepID=UPI003FD2FB14